MESIFKWLALFAAPISLLTALINMKTAVNKSANSQPLSETSIAVIALVIIFIVVVTAICYLGKK